jgi:FkbM family methyltransferase
MTNQLRVDVRTDAERAEWVRRFEAAGTRRAIFGCNQWGQSVASQIDVECFIDDVVRTSTFAGRPVVRTNEVDVDLQVLVVVVVGRPLSAREAIRRSTNSSVSYLDYYSFLKFTTLKVEQISYIADAHEELQNHRDFYESLPSKLHDEESRVVLSRVLELRTELNLEAMVDFTDRQGEQYFEEFIRVSDDSVFLDVGAYDGYTTEFARSKYGSQFCAHVFEPSPKGFGKLRTKFAGDALISVHQYGLSDMDGDISFDEAGSASRLGSGSSTVNVRTLDSLGFPKVDLVKVDIEGGEEAFIRGASETIARCQPQVAIACYHSTSQIRTVYSGLRSLMPEARVYMRHYTEGFAETDMFFIPPRFFE